MANRNAKKPQLRTSKDVYNRIRWDFMNKVSPNTADDSDVTAKPSSDTIAEWRVGYEDRFLGMQEMSLEEFVPLDSGGDIPWHRVYYFKKNNEILWDRRLRLDKIFGSGHAGGSGYGMNRPQTATSRDKQSEGGENATVDDVQSHDWWPPNFQALISPCYFYDQEVSSWVSCTGSVSSARTLPELDATGFRIVTYNVLNDFLANDRLVNVIRVLRETDAHIIALQEVTKELLELIAQDDWIMEQRYFLTHLSFETDKNDNLLVLSKFQILQSAASKTQRQLGVVVKVPNVGEIKLVNVHFTSSYRENDAASTKRGRQKRMTQLSEALQAAYWNNAKGVVPILLGDFNFGSESQEQDYLADELANRNMRDAWETLRGAEDKGQTFNPTLNALAAKTSVHHRTERFDRILIGWSDQFVPKDITMIGDGSASDHFGLQLHLQFCDVNETSIPLSQLPRAYTSALCLVPSQAGPLWPLVQALRERHDPAFGRWPPHLNLMFPLIENNGDNLLRVKASVDELLRMTSFASQPLRVVFARFGIFVHRSSCHVFLFPSLASQPDKKQIDLKLIADAESVERPPIMLFLHETKQKLVGLDAAAFELFTPNDVKSHPLNQFYELLREKLPQAGDADRDILVPHLTVGKFSNFAEAASAAQSWRKCWRPVYCDFAGVQILQKDADRKFTKKYVSDWCNSPVGGSKFSRAGKREFVELFKERLLSVLSDNPGIEAEWLGSFRLGTDTIDSDCDLAVFLPESFDVQRIMKQAMASEFKFFAMEPNERSKQYYYPGITFSCWQMVTQEEESLLNLARFEDSTKSLQVEVVFAKIPRALCSLSLFDLQCMELSSLLPVSGVNDAIEIGKLVDSDRSQIFREFCLLVKQWTQLRGLDRKACGYLPSFAWTLMAARVFLDFSGVPSVTDLTTEFFGYFSRKLEENNHIVALTDDSVNSYICAANEKVCFTSSSKLVVLAPTFPFRNQAEHMTESAFLITKLEISRAHQLLSASNNRSIDSIFSENNLEDNIYCSSRIALRFTTVVAPEQSHLNGECAKAAVPVSIRVSLKWLDGQLPRILREIERCVDSLAVKSGSRITVRPVVAAETAVDDNQLSVTNVIRFAAAAGTQRADTRLNQSLAALLFDLEQKFIRLKKFARLDSGNISTVDFTASILNSQVL